MKLRDETKLSQEEQQFLQGLMDGKEIVDDESTITPFQNSLMRGLRFLTHLTKSKLTLKNLVSSASFELNNGVALLVFGRAAVVPERPESPNPIHFLYIPLSLFELIHFNVYDHEQYVKATREMRTNASQLSRSVTTSAFSLSPRSETKSKYSSSKWTKVAVKLVLAGEKSSPSRRI